jgi:hypothetical protein
MRKHRADNQASGCTITHNGASERNDCWPMGCHIARQLFYGSDVPAFSGPAPPDNATAGAATHYMASAGLGLQPAELALGRRVTTPKAVLLLPVGMRAANSGGPGGPTGPLISYPDRESPIGNAPSLVPGPVARL